MPTFEDLTTDLNGAKIFSKIDLTSVYSAAFVITSANG